MSSMYSGSTADGWALQRYDVSENTISKFSGLVADTRGYGEYYTQYDETMVYMCLGSGIYTFDMQTEESLAAATIPSNVGYTAAMASSETTGAVYVTGGTGPLDTVFVLILDTMSWLSNVSSMTYGRQWHASIVLNDKLYAIAGSGRNTIECIDTLHIQDASWRVWDDTFHSIAMFGMVAVGDVVFAMGGHGERITVYTIDTKTETWALSTDALPYGIRAPAAIAVNNEIFLFGVGDNRRKWMSYVAPTSTPTAEPTGKCPSA